MNGKITVAGIGPGGYEDMTLRAVNALSSCDVIIGYTVYIDLIKEYFDGKTMLTTPMKQEEKRCRMAFEEAISGKNVCMVCSGDAGVYGMASLIYELSVDYPDVDIEIISGVTAALSGGALLGAPLSHDFAVISLSDLLTPWEVIEKRLEAAAAADLVICLYNPSSKKRAGYLKAACNIIMRHADESTVCGVASDISRKEESYRLMTLKELSDHQADMFTTVFIGNSSTKIIKNKMVTPRGYHLT